MKFEEALRNFKNELWKEYGPDMDIVKIAITPKLFEAVVIEFYQRKDFSYHNGGSMVRSNVRLIDIGEFKLEGTQVLAREKDTF